MAQVAFNRHAENLLSKVTLYSQHGLAYTIFGQHVLQVAKGLAEHNLVDVMPCAAKNPATRLKYYTITPTEIGEIVWRQHLRSPLKTKHGGKRAGSGRKPLK